MQVLEHDDVGVHLCASWEGGVWVFECVSGMHTPLNEPILQYVCV